METVEFSDLSEEQQAAKIKHRVKLYSQKVCLSRLLHRLLPAVLC